MSRASMPPVDMVFPSRGSRDGMEAANGGAVAPPVSKEEAAQHRAAPASVFEAGCMLAWEVSQGVWLTPGNGGEIVEGLVGSGNASTGQPPVAVIGAVHIGRLASRREHFLEKLLWRARLVAERWPITCVKILAISSKVFASSPRR